MTLIFATNNAHKLHEAREKLRFFTPDIELMGLSEAGFSGELPETGNTLHANALQKAQTLYENLSQDCFADDTGLEIEALNGAPGVYSARYAEMLGDNIVREEDARSLSEAEMRSLSGAEMRVAPTFDENMNLVLSQLHEKTNRRARFRTVIALILKGEIHYFEGCVNGEITTEKHGTAGFGYDPIFRPDGYEKTFAELPLDVKNTISHRGRAIEEMANWVKELTIDN